MRVRTLLSPRFPLALLLVGFLAACGEGQLAVVLAPEGKPDASVGQSQDAGTGEDGGVVPGADAGTSTDAGSEVDGGADAGVSDDAGTGTDGGSDVLPGSDAGTGPGSDAGTGTSTDAGTGADAGTSQDAGTGTGSSDAGSGVDAGTREDAGTGTGSSDAGSAGDAGSGGGSTDAGASDAGSGSGGSDAGSDVDAGTEVDAGSSQDAGSGPGVSDAGSGADAGSSDAGSGVDAGSGPGESDAGTALDAGSGPGGSDAGTALDAGSGPGADAGTGADAGSGEADAGTALDAGPGPGGSDAGTGADAGSGPGGSDAGTALDAGSGPGGSDAGTGADAGSGPGGSDAGTAFDAGAGPGTGEDAGSGPGGLDAGSALDAGSGPGTDAGTGEDAGMALDAGAGPGADAGMGEDAGSALDAGAGPGADAGTPTDAGTGPDAGMGGDGGSALDGGSVEALPVDAGVDQALCIGAEVQVGPEPEAGFEYQWSPSQGLSSASVARPLASPTVTTTYTVTVRDPATGRTGTDSVVVTVHGRPVARAGADAAVCPGGSVTLGVAVSEALTYAWSPAEGLSTTSGPQPVATPGATTTYLLTVTDANGCSAQDDVTVTVRAAPVARIAAGAKVCGGSGWRLSGGGSSAVEPATLTGYEWTYLTPSGTTQVSGVEPEFSTPAGPATVEAQLTVTDSHGCIGSTSLVGAVLALPTVDAGPDVRLRSGASAVVGNPATGGASPYAYAWSASPACPEGSCLSSASVARPSVSPTEDTRFTVTVMDAEGCGGSDSVAVSLIPPLVAHAGTPRTLCEGQSAPLGAAATGGEPPYTYAWSASPACTGCLSSTTEATVTATPAATTTFMQTVTDALGGTASSSVTLTVAPNPGTLSGSRLLDPGASITLGPAPVAGARYAWSCNRADCALSSTAVAQPVAGPTRSTTYTLDATSAEGCTTRGSMTVWVNLRADTAPRDGEAAFPLGSQLLVQFDQPIAPATLTPATVLLSDALTGAPVSVSLTYVPETRQLWVKPSGSNYVAGMDYTLTLVGGPSGIASADGVLPNLFPSDQQVDFTTAAADTTAPGIAFRSPAAGATAVPSNATVVVTFNEALDPTSVTGSTFTLTSAAGAAVGTVRYDATTWTATFTPSVPLAFSTTYTVGLTGMKDLSGNPLTASWTFTTGTAPDLTAPTVTAVSPLGGATGVASSTPLDVTFSEAVDTASLSGIRLLDVAAGTQVAGSVTYNATTRVATFVPTVLLGSLVTYEVNVSGVKDLAGNPMTAPFTSRFTTGRTLFFDDFEGGTGAWLLPAPTTGSPWLLATNSFHSASRSLSDSGSVKYTNNVQSFATLAQPLPIHGLSSVTVQFWARVRAEKNKDFLYVDYSLDGGAWTQLPGGRYSGNQGWAVRSLPLSVAGKSSLLLRFRFETNANKVFDGVYVDDVVIQSP